MYEMTFFALLTAVFAMVSDLRTGRISNRFLLLCASAGCGFHIWMFVQAHSAGFHDPGEWIRAVLSAAAGPLAGALIPVLLLGWLFLFRMIGAADIKLLAVLGILLGPEKSFVCVLWTMIFAAVFAAGIMASNANFRERFSYFAGYVKQYLMTHRRMPYRGKWDSRSNLHMTVPVLMAVLTVTGIL